MMKTFGLILLLAALVSGCATPKSTIESRKTERAAAYAALKPEERALIDQGHIKIGMTEDAVYIAWGQPSQVQNSESASGIVTTWIYTGTGYQEHRYWSNHRYGYGFYGRGRHGYAYGYTTPLPTLEYDYVPYRYTSAEVIFEKGLVKSWKHLSPPPVQ
jgi:hypothetical protein